MYSLTYYGYLKLNLFCSLYTLFTGCSFSLGEKLCGFSGCLVFLFDWLFLVTWKRPISTNRLQIILATLIVNSYPQKKRTTKNMPFKHFPTTRIHYFLSIFRLNIQKKISFFVFSLFSSFCHKMHCTAILNMCRLV